MVRGTLGLPALLHDPDSLHFQDVTIWFDSCPDLGEVVLVLCPTDHVSVGLRTDVKVLFFRLSNQCERAIPVVDRAIFSNYSCAVATDLALSRTATVDVQGHALLGCN